MISAKSLNLADAHLEAQKITFGPVVFQTARLLREFGVLALLDKSETPLGIEAIASACNLTHYATKILCESGYSMMALEYDEQDETYTLSKVGHFLEHDTFTRVNMDFNHDVNYLGLYHLEEALKEGKPAGLKKVFGNWESIYPKLSELPPNAKESWFAFDHFYSDNAFKKYVKIIGEKAPKKLLDVGGNTGKWAVAFAKKSPTSHITILDHPGQIK